MCYIICKPDLFTMNQEYTLVQDGSITAVKNCSMEDLPWKLVSMARDYEVSDIKLMAGPYAQNIKNTIFALTATDFKHTVVNVEIVE